MWKRKEKEKKRARKKARNRFAKTQLASGRATKTKNEA